MAAERERIAGIQALAQPGFEAEIRAAIEDGSTVEAAGLVLFKAAADRGVTVVGIKRDATQAGTTTPPDTKGAPKLSVSSIWASRKGAKQ